MASGTSWYPYVRADKAKLSWLLDDGQVMDEPVLETTSSQRRVRLAGVPEVADYTKNINEFLGRAAETAARQQGRRLWMALGRPSANTLDQSSECAVENTHLAEAIKPHFLSGRTYTQETQVAWRFRHSQMPIEAQIECKVHRRGYGDGEWQVTTKLVYPGTSPLNSHTPVYFSLDQGNRWPCFVNGQTMYGALNTRLNEWAQANPIEWLDGFSFGSTTYPNERQAINAFAKVIRAVSDLDEIDIPNLLNIREDGADVNKDMQMLSLRVYKTNASQDLLEILTDYLSGEPLVDQIKAKWLELNALFRNLGMVLGDPKETEWWNFLVKGADAAPLEVELSPVTDEQGENHPRQSVRHSVMVNLATGTIVVACSKSATKDETAIQWETSKLKAELTGEKDRFLAYADAYLADRQNSQVTELMKTAVKQAKTK